MITTITGIRDLAPESYPDVELAVLDECHAARELRFGGALGADTVALLAACKGACKRVAYVPGTLRDVPAAARAAIEECADEVIELKRNPARADSYLRRNDAMLDGSHKCLAFTDGRTTGGTDYTMRAARGRRIPLVIVPVRAAPQKNPKLRVEAPDFLFPVYALERYVSRVFSGGSALTKLIWKMKGYNATPGELDALADALASLLVGLPNMPDFEAIVPMPRRLPGRASDLAPLALRLAARLEVSALPEWLERTEEPKGGFEHQGRTHYGADEHARTLRVLGPERPRSVLLLDNVVTFSGTIAGAQQAIVRDTRTVRAPALALACASGVRCENAVGVTPIPAVEVPTLRKRR